MTEHAGVLRSARSLDRRRGRGATTRRRHRRRAGHEVRNLQTVAQALCAAAEAREETRGAHARVEFPTRDDRLAVRFVLTTAEGVL